MEAPHGLHQCSRGLNGSPNRPPRPVASTLCSTQQWSIFYVYSPVKRIVSSLGGRDFSTSFFSLRSMNGLWKVVDERPHGSASLDGHPTSDVDQETLFPEVDGAIDTNIQTCTLVRETLSCGWISQSTINNASAWLALTHRNVTYLKNSSSRGTSKLQKRVEHEIGKISSIVSLGMV